MPLASLLQQLVDAGIVPEGTTRVVIDVFEDEPTRVYFEIDESLLDMIEWADSGDLEVQGEGNTSNYDRWASSLPF